MTENELRKLFVSTAESYLGCKESDGSHKVIIDLYNKNKPSGYYTMRYTDPWCATFVSAVSAALGLTDIIPMECGCERQINLFKALGRWQEDESIKPELGDIIFYDWNDNGYGDNTGFSDHVGIVAKVDGNTLTIIEGNVDNKVGYRTIANNARYIRGYGKPDYASKASGMDKPVENKKTVEEIAREVINGKWGNGAERKRRLMSAGYSFTEVQDAVNAILSGSTAVVKESECEVKLPVLKNGSTGNSVKALQLLLIGNGCSCGDHGADGDFGSDTEAAVKNFQGNKGLTIDGKAGPETWSALLK